MGPFEEYANKIRLERSLEATKENQEFFIENINNYQTNEKLAKQNIKINNKVRSILKIFKIIIILISLFEIKFLLIKSNFASKMIYLLTNFISYLIVHFSEINNDRLQYINEFLSQAFVNFRKYYEINLSYLNKVITDEEFQTKERELDADLISLAQEYDKNLRDTSISEKKLKKEK